MAEYNRTNMIQAIKSHAEGHIKKHTMNVEIYLKNSFSSSGSSWGLSVSAMGQG